MISLLVSVILVILIPKVITEYEFSYWQLYLFYSTFLGFFHFGIVDGMFLEYGSKSSESLVRSRVINQFISLLFLQIMVVLIILTLINFISTKDLDKLKMIYFLIFLIPIINSKYFFTYFLQAIEENKKLSLSILLEKIFFLVIICIALLFNVKNFESLIVLDIFVKLLITIYLAILSIKSIKVSKNIVNDKVKFSIFSSMFFLKSGILILLSNVANMLIIGSLRFGIELNWDVKTLGKVSFAISIAGLLTFMLNAVGLVFYPILKKIDDNKMRIIYSPLTNIMNLCFVIILFAYFPLKLLLQYLIPSYEISYYYLGFIAPIVIFEGRVSLIILNAIYKKRLQKQMLFANLFCLLLSLSFFVILISFNDIEYIVILITVMSFIKCELLNYIVCKRMSLKYIDYFTIFSACSFILINLSGYSILNSALLFSMSFIILILFKIQKYLKDIFELKNIRR